MRALSSRPNGRQRAEKKRRQFAAVVEEMERRRLMTGAVDSVTLPAPDGGWSTGVALDNGTSVEWRTDGTVRVTGTAGDDTINVVQDAYYYSSVYFYYVDTPDPIPYRIEINGQAVTLRSGGAFPQITRLEVDAGDGNDTVIIRGASPGISYAMGAEGALLDYGVADVWGLPQFNPTVSVSGGAGDDTLSVSGGTGTLDGGTGTDHLAVYYASYQIITDPGISPTATRGRWDEIGGGAYVGLTGDDTVDLRGTDGDDVITVDWDLVHPTPADNPVDIRINGVSYIDALYMFNPGLAHPAGFRIDGAGGNDAISLTSNVPYPATLLGGAGDDTLNGDASADALHLNADAVDPGRPVDRTLGADAFLLQLPGGGSIGWSPAGVLSVHGTAGDDQILFSWRSGGYWGAEQQLVVMFNGDAWTFRPESGVTVGHIEVDAGDGNDSVSTQSGSFVYWPVRVVRPFVPGGGLILYDAASMVIYPPLHPDPGFATPLVISGGAGNDTLSGGGAHDVLYGDDGNDSLFSSYGSADELYGGAGDDELISNGSGADSLYGGAGNDHLQHLAAADALLVLGDVGEASLPVGRGSWYEFGNGVLASLADDGTLDIRGSDADDVITVSREGNFFGGGAFEMTANGVTWQLGPWVRYVPPGIVLGMGFLSVVRIDVHAGGGNDHVTLGSALRVPATVDGGTGDDRLDVLRPVYVGPVTLVGGEGADTLDGDAGADYVILAAELEPVFQPWPPEWPIFEDPPIVIYPVPPAVDDPPAETPVAAPPVQTGGASTGNEAPDVRTLVFDAPLRKAVTKAGSRAFFDGGASALWRTDGVLVIRGTSEDDLIRVARTGKGKNATILVKVNAVTRAFRVGSAIRRVEIDAGDGDDAVLLGGSDLAGSVFAGVPLDVPAVVSGGRGNDTLVGGSKADVLRGNAGRDSLEGGGGNDLLYGGVGDDTLAGGAGRDRVDDIDLDLFRGIEGVIT